LLLPIPPIDRDASLLVTKAPGGVCFDCFKLFKSKQKCLHHVNTQHGEANCNLRIEVADMIKRGVVFVRVSDAVKADIRWTGSLETWALFSHLRSKRPGFRLVHHDADDVQLMQDIKDPLSVVPIVPPAPAEAPLALLSSPVPILPAGLANTPATIEHELTFEGSLVRVPVTIERNKHARFGLLDSKTSATMPGFSSSSASSATTDSNLVAPSQLAAVPSPASNTSSAAPSSLSSAPLASRAHACPFPSLPHGLALSPPVIAQCHPLDFAGSLVRVPITIEQAKLGRFLTGAGVLRHLNLTDSNALSATYNFVHESKKGDSCAELFTIDTVNDYLAYINAAIVTSSPDAVSSAGHTADKQYVRARALVVGR
jgi:hypothetical protein